VGYCGASFVWLTKTVEISLVAHPNDDETAVIGHPLERAQKLMRLSEL